MYIIFGLVVCLSTIHENGFSNNSLPPNVEFILKAFLVRKQKTVTYTASMSENFYDEVEIEDMTYDPVLQIYHYPCPCGDRFEIGLADLLEGEEIGVCPSCSLMIKVIFDAVSRTLEGR